MSFAPNYTPTTGFATDETNQVAGRSTLKTVSLDTELANVASSINALNTNQKLLQRDDGKIKDFLIEPYALSEQTRALIAIGGNPKGFWAAQTQYSVKDVVQYSEFAYICFSAHTSGNSFDNSFWICINAASESLAAARSQYCGNAGGSANAITLTPPIPISQLSAGQSFTFKATANNVGATTISISGLNPIPAQVKGAACVGTEILSGNYYTVLVDSSGAAAQLSSALSTIFTGRSQGDQIIIGTDASPWREGTWTVASGGIYTLLGEIAMKYWSHNVATDVSGNDLGRDDSGTCTRHFFTESGIYKIYTAPAAAAGVVPVWTLIYTLDTNTGNIWTAGSFSSAIFAFSISSCNTFSAAQRGAFSVLTDAATVTPDFSLANNYKWLMSGSRTLAVGINLVEGQSGQINIQQDGTGSRLLTTGWGYRTSNGVPIVLSTGVWETDIVPYSVDVARSNTVTISQASTTWTTNAAHGLAGNQPVQLSTTGALPANYAINTTYYVVGSTLTSTTYQLSATRGGAAITAGAGQSGVHTAQAVSITLNRLPSVK